MQTFSSKPLDFFRKNSYQCVVLYRKYARIFTGKKSLKNIGFDKWNIYFSKKFYLKVKTDEKTMLMFTFIKITNTMI
jgi:hypothetical protein